MSVTREKAASASPEERRDAGEDGLSTQRLTPPKQLLIPPGWSYNPSAMRERRIMLALEIPGLINAAWIAAYQLAFAPYIWAPFFGQGSTYAVTHSMVSHILPFPDGTLGVVGYGCDILFNVIGGQNRWWQKPWVVIAYVGTISGLGVVSTLLTITQAVLVNAWCTSCITSAVISIIVFGIGFGEVLPTLQYLKRVWVRSGSLQVVWRTIWGRAVDVGAIY